MLSSSHGIFLHRAKMLFKLLANLEFLLAEDITFGESRRITAWG